MRARAQKDLLCSSLGTRPRATTPQKCQDEPRRSLVLRRGAAARPSLASLPRPSSATLASGSRAPLAAARAPLARHSRAPLARSARSSLGHRCVSRSRTAIGVGLRRGGQLWTLSRVLQRCRINSGWVCGTHNLAPRRDFVSVAPVRIQTRAEVACRSPLFANLFCQLHGRLHDSLLWNPPTSQF